MSICSVLCGTGSIFSPRSEIAGFNKICTECQITFKMIVSIYVILKMGPEYHGFTFNLSLTESVHLEMSSFFRLFFKIKSKKSADKMNASFN